MTDYTRRVAEFCAELTLADVPEEVVRHATRALTDDVRQLTDAVTGLEPMPDAA